MWNTFSYLLFFYSLWPPLKQKTFYSNALFKHDSMFQWRQFSWNSKNTVNWRPFFTQEFDLQGTLERLFNLQCTLRRLFNIQKWKLETIFLRMILDLVFLVLPWLKIRFLTSLPSSDARRHRLKFPIQDILVEFQDNIDIHWHSNKQNLR